MSYRQKVWIIAIISVILSIICYFRLEEEERKFINILGICGFTLSLMGIVIAYGQILSIKEIAIETQNKVNENITLNNNIIMLSDLARKAAMVDEIQGYLRDDKIEMCILRMRDLKVILNSLRNQDQYSSLISRKEFRNVFENFNLDLNNFQTHKFQAEGKIDKSIISRNLEALSTIFLSVEIKLKNTNHDS